MGYVRPFYPDDLPQIAALCTRAFPGPSDGQAPPLASYLEDLLLDNPWADDDLRSLVYEEDTGRITGFLGVLPRRMCFHGGPLMMAVSNYFMVDPEQRSTLAAIELAKSFLSGPQDLSLAEGNNFSRKVWEGLGGTTSLLYSLSWMRLLRPGRHFASLLANRNHRGPFHWMARRAGDVVDAVATRLAESPFRRSDPHLVPDELDEDSFLAGLFDSSRRHALRPVYDEPSLRWLLEMLSRKKSQGSLRKVLLRNSSSQPLGWYLYFAHPAGIGEVVHLGARDGFARQVLEHLFHDAWEQGLTALAGRALPSSFSDFSSKHCFFRPGPPWMLVHSGRPQLVRSILEGDAFLTRLEGEWWIGL